MKILITNILIFLLAFPSIACINEYHTRLDGNRFMSDRPIDGKIYISEQSQDLEDKAGKLLNAFNRSDSVEYLSDYGATLVYLGKYQAAKSVYEKIETRWPDLYTTASNLGTIYELLGKSDSALFWIKKSVDLNPDSHNGSEWIHIKILEFKLSEEKDYTNSILGLNFGDNDKPENLDNRDLDELRAHIYHQLYERLKFISPPNKIMGNIYFDYGNVMAQKYSAESGLESYEAASEFGFESELMKKRISAFRFLAKKSDVSRNIDETISGLLGNFDFLFFLVIALIISIFLAFRFIRKGKSK